MDEFSINLLNITWRHKEEENTDDNFFSAASLGHES